ncbi:hypothetical protein, partial [Methylobacterium nigriterrae]|uniref:hypothetical protein n=1 Tax=Methylobacterium nigriterrae TaxID=3127512 RepID=UPI0030134467
YGHHERATAAITPHPDAAEARRNQQKRSNGKQGDDQQYPEEIEGIDEAKAMAAGGDDKTHK